MTYRYQALRSSCLEVMGARILAAQRAALQCRVTAVRGKLRRISLRFQSIRFQRLARRLFDPLSARIKSELWLDRERAGMVIDLAR